jgi:hypothetical protein
MLTTATRLWLAAIVPAVTPMDRFRAMKELNGHSSSDIPWPTLVGCAAVAGLLVLLVVVNRNVARRKREKIASEFEQRADKAGLSLAERRLMVAIARYAGVPESTVVFSDHEAFCAGAAKLMQERFASGDSVEDRRNMKAAVEAVYQKLGIVSSGPSSMAMSLSSRQIPAGRQIFIGRKRGDASETIEATVLDNRHDGLVVRLGGEASVPVTRGDIWQVRYNFGPSTWEFESTVLGFEDGAVTLSHRDLARHANRRRFLRVPVKGKALVAHYAFQPGDVALEKALPKFVTGRITEIAGPGLLVETSLSVSPGDKLLIVALFENGEVIRNVAEVKHARPSKAGTTIAMELVTLTDAEVGVMVRLTNAVARKMETGEDSASQADVPVRGRA